MYFCNCLKPYQKSGQKTPGAKEFRLCALFFCIGHVSLVLEYHCVCCCNLGELDTSNSSLFRSCEQNGGKSIPCDFNPLESSAIFSPFFFQISKYILYYILFDIIVTFACCMQVNVPKQRRTFCKGKKCRRHTLHKVTQYKKGKDSLYAQGKNYKLNFTMCII